VTGRSTTARSRTVRGASSLGSSPQSRSASFAEKSSEDRGATPSEKDSTQALVKSKRARTTLATKDSAISLREEILALAGVDKNRLAELTRASIARIDEALAATVVERVTYQGDVTATFADIDHKTRLAAADRVLDIVGAKQSKSATDKGPSGPTQVNVIIEMAEHPKVRADVIEAGS
jgi:hypothetical protein